MTGSFLGRAKAAVQAGPRALVAPCVVVGILAAAAGLVIVATVGPSASPNRLLLLAGGALAAALVACVTAIVVRRSATSAAPPRWIAPGTATAAVLTMGALLVLLLVPLYLYQRSMAPQEPLVLYAWHDRRWLVAAFLIGTLGAVVLVQAFSRLVAGAERDPRTWRDWVRAALATGPLSAGEDRRTQPRAGCKWTAIKLAVAAAVALYFFGPPWGIAENLHPVKAHETFQLGALQAISDGATPYLGAASNQYGPGTQLTSYLYMHHIATVSVVGFRESFALMHWVAATVFFAVLVVRLPFRLALAAMALAVLLFPTLQAFEFTRGQYTHSGTYDGFFGWFNVLRYIGVFCTVMLLPAVFRLRSRRLLAGGALGVVWGLSCYVAQENLVAGVMGILGLSALMLLSGSVAPRTVARTLAALAVGFAAVWVWVFGAYALQGDLGRFLEMYLLVPNAVTRGYSNTPYTDGLHSGLDGLYYVLPFVLAAIGIAALLQGRPLRVATRWSQERTLLVSAVVAAVACYPGALLRSDPSHLANATLAVPVVLTLAVAYLPRMLAPGAGRRARAIGSLVIAAGVLLLLPLTQYTKWPGRLVEPVLARAAFVGAERPPAPTTLAAARIGRGLERAPRCCTIALLRQRASMPRLVGFLNTLHGVVGSRRTFVTWGRGKGMPGLVYLGAGLREPPLLVEPGTLQVDRRERRRFLAYFERHIGDVGALVTPDIPSQERDIFTRAYPAHRVVTLKNLGVPVRVLIAR